VQQAFGARHPDQRARAPILRCGKAQGKEGVFVDNEKGGADLLRDIFAPFPEYNSQSHKTHFAKAIKAEEQASGTGGLSLSPDGQFNEIANYAELPDSENTIQDIDIARIFELRYGNNLTPHETRLLRRMIAGRSLKAISEQDQVSYETRRNQLKSIMAKAEINRQTALISHLSGLLAVKMLNDPEKDRAGQENISRYLDRFYGGRARLFSPHLGDGHQLLILDMGPTSGKPVIYMHSAFFPVFPFPDDLGFLHRLNLRIITPFRPGYFDLPVDWSATPSERLTDFTRILATFLESFDLAQAPVFSHAHGVSAAIMLCQHLGNQVPQLLLHSPPYVSATAQRPQKAHIRAQALLFNRFPKLGIEFYRLLAKAVARPEKLLETLEKIFGDSEPDMRALRAPARKIWLHATLYGLGRGNLPGIVNDINSQAHDWVADLQKLPMPTMMHFGGQDKYSNYQELENNLGSKPVEFSIEENAGMLSGIFSPEPLLRILAGDTAIGSDPTT
jgi:DNA-binding CsgD family transcriptional regulator